MENEEIRVFNQDPKVKEGEKGVEKVGNNRENDTEKMVELDDKHNDVEEARNGTNVSLLPVDTTIEIASSKCVKDSRNNNCCSSKGVTSVYNCNMVNNIDEIDVVKTVKKTGYNSLNKDEIAGLSNKRTTYVNDVKRITEVAKNKMKFIPTVLTEIGKEVVVFDEELVLIGSMKWQLTLYSYFMGHKMSLPEIRYHLRSMWYKLGLKDIVDNGNGCWLFKFETEEGLHNALEKGPWMVNGKPLIVNKWNSEISIDGLSAIASSVGNPLIMDNMSANVCKYGVGRIEYARILVEMDAKKEFKENVELQYRDKNQNVKGTKVVKGTKHYGNEGVSYKKDSMQQNRWKPKQQWNRKEPTVGNHGVNNAAKPYDAEFPKLIPREKQVNKQPMKVNSNRYAVLEDEETNETHELNMMKDRMIVNTYLNRKAQPSCEETKNQSQDMITYFKRAWEADREKERDEIFDKMEGFVEEVLEDESLAAQALTANEINGQGITLN
ncbi:RNA-directed DNA polymerase, eukaryota, reverse transcriptase zinc-binding domain protein [Tanacetum coccineum]